MFNEQESLKFGLYMLDTYYHWALSVRPQTRYIQYFDEDLDRSFVSAFGEKFAIFSTTLQAKN